MTEITTVNLISGGGSTNRRVLEEQKSGGKLHGLVETAAIISSNLKAEGIQRAIDAGFPKENIHLASRARGDLGEQILQILDIYKPDYFHQLGWLPHTPQIVIERHKGLNQHLGPGGRFMIGERRIYAHLWFCQVIGVCRPIPVFCQHVDLIYDQGDVVYVRFEDFALTESVQEIAQRLLPIEHEVQIEALRLLATGRAKPVPVPRVHNGTPEEINLMDQARLEAEVHYSGIEGKKASPCVLNELEELEIQNRESR